jgi:hypothetical protein
LRYRESMLRQGVVSQDAAVGSIKKSDGARVRARRLVHDGESLSVRRIGDILDFTGDSQGWCDLSKGSGVKPPHDTARSRCR